MDGARLIEKGINDGADDFVSAPKDAVIDGDTARFRTDDLSGPAPLSVGDMASRFISGQDNPNNPAASYAELRNVLADIGGWNRYSHDTDKTPDGIVAANEVVEKATGDKGIV